MVCLGLCAVLLAACGSDADESDDAPEVEQEEATEDATDVAEGDGTDHESVVSRFELFDWDAGDEVVAQMVDGEWDGSLPEVPEDDTLRLGIRVVDADGEEVDLAASDNDVAIEFDDDADEILSIEYDGDTVDLFGETEGITRVRFQWLHEGEVTFETPSIRVVVDHFAGDYVAGREILEPEPRLLFVDADDPRAVVYDLIAEEELAAFDLEEANPTVSASRVGGQVAILSEVSAGVAHVIDVGTWAIGHGDHGHYYIDDPRLLDTLDFDEPSGSMHGPDRIAITSGSDGTTLIIDELRSLQAGEARTSEFAVGGAERAGAVPLPRGFVAAPWPAQADGVIADEIALLEGDDAVETHDCPQVAAMTPTHSGVVFACADRLLIGLLDEDDWSVHEIELSGQVATITDLAGDIHQPMVAASDGQTLLIVDTEARALVGQIELPTDAASAPHIDDDGHLLIVTDDGVLHQFDPTTGDQVASSQEMVVVDSGDDAARPSIAGGRDRAYVSSPADGQILEFATNDDLRLARTFDVGGAPSGLAYFGAIW